MPSLLADDSQTSDSRSRLIDAATAGFLEEGYRVSVERIAARAGVAKQTLYNHFPCKADLFGEVIRLTTADMLITLDEDGQNLRERLTRFGCVYRQKLLSPTGLGFYRAIMGETVRFPELAAAFYQTGPAQTASRLCAVLQQAMDLGELRQDDVGFTTTMLLSMLVGAERSQALFSGQPPAEPNPDQAVRIIDCFLQAFAPASQSTIQNSATPRSTS